MPQNLASFTGNSHRHTLPRGMACATCRRRKIKCDGHKPCKQCRRSSHTTDCQYPLVARNGAQRSQRPMTIKLETPIAVLRTSSYDDNSSIFFQGPPDSEEIPLAWTMPVSVGIAASPPPKDETRPSASHMLDPVIENPPLDVIERLVDAFFGNFSQVGFFLDVAAFRHSALLAVPFNSCQRPLPVLLTAVCAWGSRFSPALRHPVYNEDAFLVYTLQNMNHNLDGDHPKRVLHSIQAHVLVSLYYFTLGRPMEGIYHSNAAVSLALSAGLHLIKSTQSRDSEIQDTPLRSPCSLSDLAERIDGFWTVVIVNNYWAASFGSPSAIQYCDTPIDTPWPLDLDDHVSPELFELPVGCLIVDGFSTLALHSKASILLERAISFSANNADDFDDMESDAFDVLLDQFMLSLPLGLGLGCGDELKPRLLVLQTLTHAAIIRLHAHRCHTSDESRRKYLTAAAAVINIITNTDFSTWRHIDPIMGILWTTVGEVFVAELSNAEILGGGAAGSLTEQYQDLTFCLETILSAMRSFSSIPLMERFCVRLEEAYANTLLEN
ncbi:Transcriptional activator protein acu-15 [Mycena venus]|uniref:Transcriptional activator protein acu-15 n=1 Tax=Mycena venus TaxID=2733690 RepID=A0A8H6X2F0_9AGAR|nr:Transcriptional activator protein acu-15 [Mycena venus]